MDDFLGTSIQYSEQQILRLEREHAAEKERIVNELIANGFMDSDYESSTGYSSTETDNECLPINEIDDDTQELSMCAHALSKFETDEDEFIQNEVEEMEDSMQSIVSLLQMMECVMDIKSFLIFIIMAIALPHCIERGDDICGAIEYENDAAIAEHTRFIRKTVWVCSPSSNPRLHPNNEEQREEEEQTLHLDMITTTWNTQTNKMFAELERHRFKISPNDLLQCVHPCNGNEDVLAPPPESMPTLPPLLLSFGANIKANNVGMMRVFKETLAHDVGRHYLSSHGVLTLILSFAGIAAFAASNSITAE